MTDAPNGDNAGDIEALAEQMAALTEKKTAVEKRVRELLAAEDFKAGVYYAQEIFEAQQEKMALNTEIEIVRRRRNRLMMG